MEHLKLQMPQTKLRMKHLKLQMEQTKFRMRQMKLQMWHLEFQMEQTKFQMRQMKLWKRQTKFPMWQTKLRMEHLKLQIWLKRRFLGVLNDLIPILAWFAAILIPCDQAPARGNGLGHSCGRTFLHPCAFGNRIPIQARRPLWAEAGGTFRQSANDQ